MKNILCYIIYYKDIKFHYFGLFSSKNVIYKKKKMDF